jgi:hypothetical protein
MIAERGPSPNNKQNKTRSKQTTNNEEAAKYAMLLLLEKVSGWGCDQVTSRDRRGRDVVPQTAQYYTLLH